LNPPNPKENTVLTAFDVRATNLRALNSITKYPSIPTYHHLNPANGDLLHDTVEFDGPVIGTEPSTRGRCRHDRPDPWC
jgi:hypothetical protein